MEDSSACGCTWQKVNEYQFWDAWMKSRCVYCMSREACASFALRFAGLVGQSNLLDRTGCLQAALLQFENEHMSFIQVLLVVRCIFLPGCQASDITGITGGYNMQSKIYFAQSKVRA